MEATASAVSAVMVQDGIHDVILTQIFDYVAKPSGRTDEDDPNEEIIVPGTTQDEIINLTLVSRRFYQLISTFEENGSRKWNIVLEMRPSPPPQQQLGDLRRLMNNIRDHGLDADGTVIEKFRHHRHIVVYDGHKISFKNSRKRRREIKELAENIRLPGIISLAFAPPPTTLSTGRFFDRNDINRLIASIVTMLPNLLQIDMSNIICDGNFLQYINRSIEKIRWNAFIYYLRLDGFSMRRLDNLRQLVMDNSIFICHRDRDIDIEIGDGDRRGFVDFETEENDPDNMNVGNDDNDNINRFIFHSCCQNFERLSIRNAKYIELEGEDDDNNDQPKIVQCMTQKALIKFVRHAPPRLKWFRSDLSHDNIRMLQTERPTIEFLN